jgi:hypothetical protein
MDQKIGILLQDLNSFNYHSRITALKQCLQIAISSNQAFYSSEFAALIAKIELSELFHTVAPNLLIKETDSYFQKAGMILVQMDKVLK